jgi:serine O-acetyltransferase
MTSRLIRHLYGSDIHWDAQIAPGVMFVHGMGLAISSSARIGPRCILSQNVTIGMGRDAETGSTGAPVLEEGVQVGAGASLLGPITVGAYTKIMPNAVVTRSVPARSLVETPAAAVRPR